MAKYQRLVWAVVAFQGVAFESTEVLPSGVRNLNLKMVQLDIPHRLDASGHYENTAAALEKEITARDVAASRGGREGVFLTSALEGVFGSELENVTFGQYTAVSRIKVRATVPVLAYGLTDNWTVAVAVPYLQAYSALDTGFSPSTEQIDQFSSALRVAGRETSARDFEIALQQNQMRLAERFEQMGYRAPADWQGQGIGDIIVANKVRIPVSPKVALGHKTGIVLPTGAPKDIDIKNSVPFGSGTTQAFAAALIDEITYVGAAELRLNQYAKVTGSAPSRQTVRMETDAEPLSGTKNEATISRAPLVELGLSANFKFDAWTCGLGAQWNEGGRSRTQLRSLSGWSDAEQAAVAEKRDRNSSSQRLQVLAEAGYSTVAAYKRGTFPLPGDVRVGYQKWVRGRNEFAQSAIATDLNLYF